MATKTALLNLIFGFSMFAAIILFLVSTGKLLFRNIRNDDRRRRSAIITALLSVTYFAAFLTYFYFKNQSYDNSVPGRLAGVYQLVWEGGPDSTVFLPELSLEPTGKILFRNRPDSAITGFWDLKSRNSYVKILDSEGRLLWEPSWDTTGEKVRLLFNEKGKIVVYQKQR